MLCSDKSHFEKNWQAPLDFLEKNPGFTEVDAGEYIQSDNKEDKIGGYIMAAAIAYKKQDEAKLLKVFKDAQDHFGELPDVLRIMRLSYHAIIGDLAESAYAYAFASYKSGFYDQALEEMRIAFVADYRSGNYILNDNERLKDAMDLYGNIAAQLPCESIKKSVSNDKIRIGILVPNLVDDSVAYSKRVMFFARYYNSDKFELKVYSSEDLCREGADSYQRGKKYLEELKDLGVDFWAANPNVGMSQAALDLLHRLESDELDELIIQIDPAMPIAWIASQKARIKSKIHIHIGSSIYMQGLNKVLYDNQKVMEKDSLSWSNEFGRQVLLRRGTDIDAIDKCQAKVRSAIGLSEDNIVIGTLSNHLSSRMSLEYRKIICDLLKENSNLIFMPIGDIRDKSVLNIFKEEGVFDQLLLIGGSKEATAYLKVLDIYATEFPEGGSQSIVEAMACELPIVAMYCGDDHHKSIASEIVGGKWAIDEYNIKDYKKRLKRLIEDETYRINNAKSMRSRALELFSIDNYVKKVCNMFKEMSCQ